MPDITAEMKRALDFVVAMEDRSYTRTEPWRWGTAFFHDEFPVKWALNFLRMESDGPDATALAIAEEAHRIQQPAGLKHRKIHVNDGAVGDRIAQGFKDLEWIVQRLLYMVLREPPVARPPIEVVIMSEEDLKPFVLKAEMEEERNSADDARELTESRRVTAAAAHTRNIVGLIDGEVAGWGELYSDGRTAQIENIGTFERFRNKGVASAVTLRAIDLARSEGHDLFFLIADAADWPKELYRKLGFEDIGHTYEFMVRS